MLKLKPGITMTTRDDSELLHSFLKRDKGKQKVDDTQI